MHAVIFKGLRFNFLFYINNGGFISKLFIILIDNIFFSYIFILFFYGILCFCLTMFVKVSFYYIKNFFPQKFIFISLFNK
jgi:hypothetical protein